MKTIKSATLCVCGNSMFVFDSEHGEVFCSKCGLVLEEKTNVVLPDRCQLFDVIALKKILI